MANIKSAKKRARQNIVRRQKNLRRTSAIKTAIKKVLSAVESGDVKAAQTLLRDAESQMSRAVGKRVMKKNTASRKIGRLAKNVASLSKKTTPAPKAK